VQEEVQHHLQQQQQQQRQQRRLVAVDTAAWRLVWLLRLQC
jgi:hypothetical protein